jgi:hypothetical protein
VLSFGGVGVGWAPDLLCWFLVYEENAAGLFAICRLHRLPITILYFKNIVAFFMYILKRVKLKSDIFLPS